MNKWDNNNARRTATRRFCEMLENDPRLREECQQSAKVARDTLRTAGDFEDMPDDVEVRVFEETRRSSDQLVAMVLPPAGELPDPDQFDPTSVWRCTWVPYESLT